jgi:hypothetical protein
VPTGERKHDGAHCAGGGIVKRLYFLVPTVESAAQIVAELRQEGIEERHIHIVAKDHTPLEQAHLPEASVLEESDFIHAVEKGLGVGGVTGVLAGIAAVTFPPAGLVLGGGAILATGLLGAGIGALASSIIGTSVPNPDLQRFERALEEGQLLMLVDVPKAWADSISALVKSHHPEAQITGIERPAGTVLGSAA